MRIFRQSLAATESPGRSHPRRAMVGRQGRLDAGARVGAAHEGVEGSWVHAYLHRKEGHQDNAAYWYNRAGKPVCREPLDVEWVASSRRC